MQNEHQIKFIKYFSFIAIVALILLVYTICQSKDDYFHFYMLDIGQGDSIYARDKDGNDIIVDGGPNQKVLTNLGELMPFYDKKIELVVISHPHADHITGLIEVLKRYEIEKILLTDAVATTKEYEEMLEIIKSKQITTSLVKIGDSFKLSNELNIEILWPNDSFQNKKIENLNNTSIVAKLNYNKVSFLLMGDAETDVQKTLIKEIPDKLKSDILKVSHQGSKDSSNIDFIKIVNPELGIISVGLNNMYGHPHKKTLEVLENNQIKILRTDQNGRIEIVSDGINFWTKTEK